MKTLAYVALSGGVDSAVALSVAVKNYNVVRAVSFRYESKHNDHELEAAWKVADHYAINRMVVDVRSTFSEIGIRCPSENRSALLSSGPALPEGKYDGENMRQTVVPGRNTIFTSILLAIAEANGAAGIVLGVHQGDHFIYPDCRPAWFTGMRQAIRTATIGAVDLEAPLLQMDKAAVVKLGIKNDVPFHLTRTCYSGDAKACGKCGACDERRQAFELNGLPDPALVG